MYAKIIFCKNEEQLELFASRSIILYNCLKKTVGQCILKFNISLLYDPSILLLNLYIREMRAYVYQFWARIFIVAFAHKLQDKDNQNV